MHENRVLSVTLSKRVLERKSSSCVVGQWHGNTHILPSPPVASFAQKRHCLSSLLSLGQGKNSQAKEKILNIQEDDTMLIYKGLTPLPSGLEFLYFLMPSLPFVPQLES